MHYDTCNELSACSSSAVGWSPMAFDDIQMSGPLLLFGLFSSKIVRLSINDDLDFGMTFVCRLFYHLEVVLGG